MKDIFIACVDGLKGFPEAIAAVYPGTEVQLCIVHLVRASLNYVPWKSRKQVARDLQSIYRAATHGYAFLYPFRRGHGPSASQAPFMQDVLHREEQTKGREARQHLQFILLTTDQLDDVMAALAFLKIVPGIDSHRIAVAGHSFGGQLTLLAAERDEAIRAAVTFAGAAGSWERSPELRERLFSAIHNTSAAIMLTHAENDYSTAAGRPCLGGRT